LFNIFYGEKQIPTYEFTLKAEGLPSGIYFYMLKASGIDGKDYQEIRKMVLLK